MKFFRKIPGFSSLASAWGSWSGLGEAFQFASLDFPLFQFGKGSQKSTRNHKIIKPFDENVKLSIYDLNGKNVHEAHFNNRDEMSINTQSFAQGVYLVKVVTTNGIFSDKLLISN